MCGWGSFSAWTPARKNAVFHTSISLMDSHSKSSSLCFTDIFLPFGLNRVNVLWRFIGISSISLSFNPFNNTLPPNCFSVSSWYHEISSEVSTNQCREISELQKLNEKFSLQKSKYFSNELAVFCRSQNFLERCNKWSLTSQPCQCLNTQISFFKNLNREWLCTSFLCFDGIVLWLSEMNVFFVN